MSARRPASPTFASLTIALLAMAAACQTGTAPSAPSAQNPVVAPPAADANKATDLPGLHNVVTYAPNLVDGGQPEGREGLATLAAMGIKTVISVDGQKPDAATAAQLGMRYVHLPISYDTITPQRQRELAQAISSCEGPIYLHCHHGKHRSAAAMAVALVQCGTLTAEQAKARMAVSGTAKEYTGLWQVVTEAKPMPAAARKVDPHGFPSAAVVTGMVETMAGIDQVFDLVKQSEKAGWQAPQDHPDLIATKETARLHTLFTSLRDDAESKALPADYQTMLGTAIERTQQLDAAVRARQLDVAANLMTAMAKGCKECHVKFRDK